jgi:hypothetical protein
MGSRERDESRAPAKGFRAGMNKKTAGLGCGCHPQPRPKVRSPLVADFDLKLIKPWRLVLLLALRTRHLTVEASDDEG